MLVSHDFLLMGNSCMWGGLNCGTCQFPHPPGNLRRVAGHIMRERGMYIGLHVDTCANTLMNGYWEELIGKVEELLHATDDPDNYRMVIQPITEWSFDGRQRLISFLRLHVRKRVQGVIECEWLCINPCRHWQTGHGRYTGG